MKPVDDPFVLWTVNNWGIWAWVISAIVLMFTEYCEILMTWVWHTIGDPCWTWIIVARKRDIWHVLLYMPAMLVTIMIAFLLVAIWPLFVLCSGLVHAARNFRDFYQELPD